MKINFKTSESEKQKIKQKETMLMKDITNHIILSGFLQSEILQYIEENSENKNASNITLSSVIMIETAKQIGRLINWYDTWIKFP